MSSSATGLRVAAWAMSVIGLLLLLGASIDYLSMRNKKRRWTAVEGQVTGYVTDISKGGASPIIVYVWEQDSMAYTSPIYDSPPAFEIEETVSLFVNPSDPFEVFHDTWQQYLLSAILAGVGVVLELVGLAIVLGSKRI